MRHTLAPLAHLELSGEANSRISEAISTVEVILMEEVRVAWEPFLLIEERAKLGRATIEERRDAFVAAQRTAQSAHCKGVCRVLDAIAAEYRRVTTDHQSYIDQLHQRALPAARTSLPLLDSEPLIMEVLRARIAYWEKMLSANLPQPSQLSVRRGRPSSISIEAKINALRKKLSGGTNSESASILYGTKRPTGRQQANVPSILKHFQNSPSCPDSLKHPTPGTA